MSTDILHILYNSTEVGRLEYQRKRDEMILVYEESWRFGTKSFPISLSLPLEKQRHADGSIRPFLQGLLPDNPAVIDAWGKRFQVSPRNPFDVIKHVGEDCAGALQFVKPERLGPILSGDLDSLIPLSEDDLAKRIEDTDAQAAAIPTAIHGRFSLAGAQTKDALHQKGGRWFVPCGRIPTTHILKPELDGLPHHVLNEYFCLQLAAKSGLMKTESSILRIAERRILCVKRYDRSTDAAGRVTRWHQEDLCQALGRYPNQKYQNDGGASAAEIINLLENYSDNREEDISQFIMALAFNWIIAGTDAHSKNYSLLHASGSFLRLAPFYDLASWLPYERDQNSSKVKLAMKIGGSYRLHEINFESWKRWASEAKLDTAWVTAQVRTTIERILQFIPATRDLIYEEDDGFLTKLSQLIAARAEGVLLEK